MKGVFSVCQETATQPPARRSWSFPVQYEIQIDDEGAPDGDMMHKTGAIYDVQQPTRIASNPPGE